MVLFYDDVVTVFGRFIMCVMSSRPYINRRNNKKKKKIDGGVVMMMRRLNRSPVTDDPFIVSE